MLPTREFLYGLQAGTEYAVDLEPGVRLLIGIQAVSDPDDRGMRTVIGTLNGQLRPVTVRDQRDRGDREDRREGRTARSRATSPPRSPAS